MTAPVAPIAPDFSSPEMVLGVRSPWLTEGAQEVNDHLNRLGTAHFVAIAESPNRDESSGMQYVLVGSRALAEGFHGAAIAMDAPFGNGIWPHIVGRAEVVSEMAYRAGMRDGEGNPIPVLLRAAPSADSRFGVHPESLKLVAKGNPSPIAIAQNDVATRAGVNSLHGDVSFSQPSAHASTRMIDAKKVMDVRGGVLLGDPPHAEETTVGERLISFVIREGARFKKSTQESGIDILQELIHSPKFVSGIISSRREGLPIARGFTKGLLVEDLIELHEAEIPSTVLHASDSFVARRHAVVTAVNVANQSHEGDDEYRTRRVEIYGANHSFADLLGHFGVTAAGILAANHKPS